MDFGTKVGMGLFALWVVSLVIGGLIVLAPVILFVLGFILMMAILTLLGRLVASWFFY